MKGKPQQSTPGPKEQPPQDVFGLGIQVFKIDAKKDTMDNSSAGKSSSQYEKLRKSNKKNLNTCITGAQVAKRHWEPVA